MTNHSRLYDGRGNIRARWLALLFVLAFILGLTAEIWDPYAHADTGHGHGKPTPSATATPDPTPSPTETKHHGKPSPTPSPTITDTPWGCIGDGCDTLQQ
jgi:hypothetical protein